MNLISPHKFEPGGNAVAGSNAQVANDGKAGADYRTPGRWRVGEGSNPTASARCGGEHSTLNSQRPTFQGRGILVNPSKSDRIKVNQGAIFYENRTQKLATEVLACGHSPSPRLRRDGPTIKTQARRLRYVAGVATVPERCATGWNCANCGTVGTVLRMWARRELLLNTLILNVL